MPIPALVARFDQLLRAGDHGSLYAELYAPTVVSVEADGKRFVGMAAIHAKNEWWFGTFEPIQMVIDGPFPHGEEAFAYHYRIRTRTRATGEETDITEIALYDVAGGKIVSERFFYVAEEMPDEA